MGILYRIRFGIMEMQIRDLQTMQEKINQEVCPEDKKPFQVLCVIKGKGPESSFKPQKLK